MPTDLERLASVVIDAVVPGHRLVSVVPARAAFTNSVQVVDTLSPAGSRLRLVVKRMTDDPDPERATADFHGLRIARRHGIPAPEPVLLDAAGELLGVPGIVTTFVEGTQNANPDDPRSWARDVAELLLKIHDVRPDADERRNIYHGNELALYFLSGEYPDRMAGHPLSDTIYDAVRELRGGLVADTPVFVHMDFWPGNILWEDGRISAVLDWDASGHGDRAIDVANFMMEMHLRGIREAAQPFLEHYEASSGPVRNLGFWELASAARPLPNPAAWIPEPGDLGDLVVPIEKADTDYYEFVRDAVRRGYAGR